MYIVFLTIGLVLTTVFTIKRTYKSSPCLVMLKALSSAFFIFTAITAFVFNNNVPLLVGVPAVIGAVFGLLGDISLDLKYVYPQDHDVYLKGGFTAFSIGHLFYIVSIFFSYELSFGNYAYALFGLVALIISVPVTEKLMKLDYNKFKLITIMYSAILGFTDALSFSVIFTEGVSVHTVLHSVGLTLFLLSDAVLSGLYFAKDEKKRKSRPSIIINHIFYYSAQYILAVSLAFYRG